MSREEARWLTAGKGAAGRGSAQARVAQGRGREEEAGEARAGVICVCGKNAEWNMDRPDSGLFSLVFHVRVSSLRGFPFVA